MDSEDQKALQEKIFSRLNARVSEAARGVKASSEDLFRQIEALSADLGQRVEEGAAEAAAAVADELALAKENARKAVEQTSGLAFGVLAILDKTDQLSVLESLLEEALHFTDGAVLFVLKDDNLGGWRAGGRIGSGQARNVHFPLSSRNSLARALRDRETLRVSADDFAEGDSALFDDLGAGRPGGFVAVPLVIRENAQALLFCADYPADGGTAAPDDMVREALRALAAAAMSAIRSLQGRSRKDVEDERAATRERVAPKPETPAPPAPPATPAPPAPPAPPRTVEPPAQPANPAPEPAAPAADPPRPGTAQAIATDPSEKPRSPWFTPTTMSSSFGTRDTAPEKRNGFGLMSPAEEGDDGEPLSPEEQELHDDARRFARLLVSEIKLYNEEKVTEGRRERDLYQRLRTDIERSRQMYNERVPPSIAAKTNYFMDELVSILAEGDRSILGM